MVLYMGKESDHQKAFVEWLDLHPLLKDKYTASANGEMRPTKTYVDKKGKIRHYSHAGLKLKRMGVKPDWPDIFIALKTPCYGGLFIEVKRPEKYHLSDGQKRVIDMLNNEGFCARVGIGVDHCIRITLDYLADTYLLHP